MLSEDMSTAGRLLTDVAMANDMARFDYLEVKNKPDEVKILRSKNGPRDMFAI